MSARPQADYSNQLLHRLEDPLDTDEITLAESKLAINKYVFQNNIFMWQKVASKICQEKCFMIRTPKEASYYKRKMLDKEDKNCLQNCARLVDAAFKILDEENLPGFIETGTAKGFFYGDGVGMHQSAFSQREFGDFLHK
eukprot:GEZU01032625.1.p1 GENE.GEZU01032625.1~~GEZU01032625.1.p1  ORF type:complete len:140 (-),score=38.24 GEZU01032625.1:252-671(-)